MLQKMTLAQDNAYQSTNGTSAKEQFREDWTKAQHASAEKGRVEKQTCKEADPDISENKVLAKIVEDEGFAVDAPGASKRAQSITSKCAQLGGKWVHFDVMRNELTFLHVRQQYNHTFEHAWNLFHDRKPHLCDVDLHGEARLHFDCHRQARWRRRHPLRVLDGTQSAWPRERTQTKISGPMQRW